MPCNKIGWGLCESLSFDPASTAHWLFRLLIYLANIGTLSMVIFTCMAMWRECWASGIKNKTPSAASTVPQEALVAHYPKEPTFPVSICANHASSVRLAHFALTSRQVKSSWTLPPLSVPFQPRCGNISIPAYINEISRHRNGETGNTRKWSNDHRGNQPERGTTSRLLQPASPPSCFHLLLLSISPS